MLLLRLFTLQIIKGEENAKKFEASITRRIPIKSARGSIFDRNGVPLATNKIVFNLKFDSSQKIKNINQELLAIIDVLEKNQQDIKDALPISKEKPYEFLHGSQTRETRWKKDNALDEKLKADEVIGHYIKKFNIQTEDMQEKKVRQLVGLRYEIDTKKYKKYSPIDIALDIPQKVITTIEENNFKFPGVYVEAEPIRNYPNSEYFSHITGYTGNINSEELEKLKERGYSDSSIVGKLGIEKEMELEIRGVDGEVYVEVDNFGRIIETTSMTQTKAGNDIFLTIDSNLQKKAGEILRNKLTDIIISRIYSKKPQESISLEQIFDAIAKNNVIDTNKILEGDKKYQLKTATKLKDFGNSENLENRQIFYELFKQKKIYYLDIIMLLIEQGKIVATEAEMRNIEAGNVSYLAFIIDRMRKGEITPQDLAFDPCSAAAVVQDVHTGEILALVNYPSYDSNMLANNFNYEYYKKLLNDKTTPLINRALSQRKAPGSTFKMISSLAGLEEKAIGPNDTIYDKGVFEDAGKPYAKCWSFREGGSASTHGHVDVKKSLEVSCNFFYYALSYRFGVLENRTTRSALKGINTLNKYVKMFGLSEKSGIEIPELESNPEMSSPENKEKAILRYNKKATSYQTKWYDGDTIRSAIGQGWNNYAPIHVAKYISTLANGGNRYKSYVIKSEQTKDGDIIFEKGPVLEERLNIAERNIRIVHEGMLRVTNGGQGTTRAFFKDFPIKVAGKTGTAQEGTKPAHGWFVGFAPYDNPQISVTVMIPYGYSSSNAVPVGRDIIGEYFAVNMTTDKDSKKTVTQALRIEDENVLVE